MFQKVSIFTFFLFLFFFQSSCYQFPSLEFETLFQFYQSTQGYNWEWMTPYNSQTGYPWNFTDPIYSNPCNESFPWQGIQCNSDCNSTECFVISLSLENYNLVGTIVPQLANLYSLTILSLSANTLNGSIPESLMELAFLTELKIDSNYLTGNIPDSIQNLTSLSTFSVENNHLTGTLPIGLTQLISLETLILSNNRISGIFYPSFGNLTALKYLEMSDMLLYGSIPKEIRYLKSLIKMDLSFNQITGTIPSEFQYLPHLVDLTINSNKLHGLIPKELGSTKSLIYFQCYDNKLSGTLPKELAQNNNLYLFDFFQNEITGTIPTEYSNFTQMYFFSCATNHLTGTIPGSLGNWSNVVFLYFDNNYFSGSLPNNFGYLQQVTMIFVSNNLLSNSLPQSLNNLTSIIYFFVDHNLFSGSITFTLWNQLSYSSIASNQFSGTILFQSSNNDIMSYFDLSQNYLTGTLPFLSTISSNYLFYTSFASNYFFGTIPNNLDRFSPLQYFSVMNNLLTGSLPENIGNQSVHDIYLANNFLTGTFPSSFFGSSELITVVASLNCFSGTIPNSFCFNPKLFQLTLDGLHSNVKCINPIYSFDSRSGYSIRNGVHGTIPACLFELSDLAILHLSGNELHGSLPNFYNPLNLSSLILSNNMLTGTIPDLIWDSKIIYLDLSFNRFTSDIKYYPTIHQSHLYFNISSESYELPFILSQPQINKTKYLQVNRFSGNIPRGFLNTSTPVNILEGNMFACDFSKSNLPSQDPNYDSYQCGSDFTNISLFVWVGVLLVIVMLIWWIVGRNRIERSIKELLEMYNQFKQYYVEEEEIIDHNKVKDSPSPSNQLNPPSNSRLDIESLSSNSAASPPTIPTLRPSKASITSLIDVNRAYYHFIRLLLNILLWTLFVILPCYVILTKYYGVYTHQYVWILSSAYLEDEVAAVVLLCLYSTLMMIIAYPLLRVGREQVGVKMRVFGIAWIDNFIWLNEKIFLCIEYSKSVFYNKNDPEKKEPKERIKVSELPNHQEEKAFTDQITGNNEGYSDHLLKEMFWRYYKISLIVFFDVMIVLLVNIGYVSAINGGYNNTQLTFIFLSISFFKLIWSNFFLLGLGRLFAEKLLGVKIQTMTIVLTSIFNNVIAPYVAEGFVSPNCFLYTIKELPSITSNYFNSVCEPVNYCMNGYCTIGVSCPFKYEIFIPQLRAHLTYIPPYHYSYACSSSLLTSFAFVFVYRYLVSGLIEFFWFIILKYSQINYMVISKYCNFEKISILKILTNLLPPLLRYQIFIDIDNPTIFDATPSLLTITHLDHSISNHIHVGERVIVRLITDFALLLSFGVIFPPLAIIIFISMIKDFSIVYFSLSQIIRDSTSPSLSIFQEKIFLILTKLNLQFKGFHKLLWLGVWWSSLVSVCFWSFTLFDTLGNKVGALAASWIVFFIILSPFWTFIIIKIYIYSFDLISLHFDMVNVKKNEENNEEIELSDQICLDKGKIFDNPLHSIG